MTGEGCESSVARPWCMAPCLATSNVTIGPVRTKYSAALNSSHSLNKHIQEK